MIMPHLYSRLDLKATAIKALNFNLYYQLED